jgi:hypothetical protein
VKQRWKIYTFPIFQQKELIETMELFLFEHKKLWRRKGVQMSVLLCFLYIVIFGGVLSYQWFQFGSVKDFTSAFGNRFDGYSNIQAKQQYAGQWTGELTDDVLQVMVSDYQSKAQSDEISDYEMTDRLTLNSWVRTLWPELKQTDNPYIMINYINPEQLTNLYERRHQAVDDFLELNGQTDEEKEYFLNMDSAVQQPFRYDWVEGWSEVIANSVSGYGMIMALFLAVALSSMFSGEGHSNTKQLITTTKNGWQKIALAKTGVSVAFALELYAVLAVGTIGAQLVFLGTRGFDMPIQCIKLIATAPWTMLQAEIYEYAYLLLSTIGFTGIVLLLSALVKSNFASLLASLAVVYVPMAITQFLPLWGQRLLDLIPFVGDSSDIFRTNTYHLFGHIIWSPYLLITVPVCVGLVCIPFAIRCWSRRAKT